MLSEEAKAVDLEIRMRKGAGGSLDQRRADEELALSALPIADGATVRSVDVVGDSILVEPPGYADTTNAPTPVVMYLHGGAYVTGSGRSRASIASHLAAATGLRVVSVDYRLAPEHPFPAGLDDALLGLNHCDALSGGTGTVVIGDSAGGGLAVATMLRARDLGLPLPLCAVLYSPWTDLTLGARAVKENADSEAMMVEDLLAESASGYAGSESLQNPLLSPRFADVTGLPPMAIFVSSEELFLDDALALVEQAARARILIELHVWPQIFHAWPVATGTIPESDAVIGLTSRFVSTCVESAKSQDA
ncbi:MAG TPA: alpha/beta hydrolase [Acidimicrobiales bacterium]|nr:alpha/beta hydrolase [Acidimicrobiales bacterium]